MACLAITGAMIDPYCSNGGAFEFDTAKSTDYGRGEDGTL